MTGNPARVEGQPRTAQGMTLLGACAWIDWTTVELALKRKIAWPAIIVPTHVPWGVWRVVVAEVTGSSLAGPNDSPPITEPAMSATTAGLLAVPLSMTATTMPLPVIPWEWRGEAPIHTLVHWKRDGPLHR